MMKLYVVRHGQTKWNEQGRMQGAKNSDLTIKGIDEAKRLNEYIKDIKFDRIYVSPLGRTLETMEHVKGSLDIPIKTIDELQEMNFGRFEGELLSELREEFPEDMYNLWQNPDKYIVESGEDYKDVFNRVEIAIEKILENKDKEENVLVVTHGVIISVLLSIVKNKEVKDLWDTPVVRNTSLSIIEFDGEDLKIIEENIINHLN